MNCFTGCVDLSLTPGRPPLICFSQVPPPLFFAPGPFGDGKYTFDFVRLFSATNLFFPLSQFGSIYSGFLNSLLLFPSPYTSTSSPPIILPPVFLFQLIGAFPLFSPTALVSPPLGSVAEVPGLQSFFSPPSEQPARGPIVEVFRLLRSFWKLFFLHWTSTHNDHSRKKSLHHPLTRYSPAFPSRKVCFCRLDLRA